MKTFVFFLSALFSPNLACVFLQLDDGIIRGRIAPIPESTDTFYAFQEIPYAAPPVGELRFKPPQPVTKWENILDTTKNTKICYQVTGTDEKETEDCLYLNVYTPKLPSDSTNVSLPVMVSIHGGGFIVGNSIHRSFGPEFLISRQLVIVTLNYRLGPFGFLSTQDEVVPGNNGLKDQLFALQWVQKNIHKFGGDASRVTIIGQSAGAASVGYHLLSAKSRGLYRAAIMESGSPISPWAYQRDPKMYTLKTLSYIYPGKTFTTSEEILEAMKTATAAEIDAASQNVTKEESYDNAQLFQGYYYAPVLEPESEEAFLTEKMFEVTDRGDADRVPVIIGINSEESLSQTTDLNFLSRVMGAFDKNLGALVPNDMNVEPRLRTEVGEQIKKIYSGDKLLQEVPSAGVRYMSDTSFTRSVIKFASLLSSYSDVYFYQFSYDGNMGNVSVIIDGTDRVGHNEELAYIWRIVNDMFDNYNLKVFPNSDVITHNRLLTLWTNFAKVLNPTPKEDNLLQNITWPKFSSGNSFSYLDINENLEIMNNPKNQVFAAWNGFYETYGNRPYDTF